MAKLYLSALLLVACVSSPMAVLFLNYEEDLRGKYTFGEDIDGEINALSGSVRQVFSDKNGDRFMLYLQGELEHNLQERIIHQLYGRYKGPMGKWNITLGRVPLPWGLLTNWSAERLPYHSPYAVRGLLKSDNGLLVSGTIGMVDYGVSLTQGYGMNSVEEFPGPGLCTMRVGVTPLLSGDLTVGVSGSVGTSYRSGDGHHGHEAMPVEHLSGAIDLTAYIGRGTLRMEAGGERVAEIWEHQGFVELEYQLLPKLALLGAGNLFSEGERWNGTLYMGASTKLKSVTLRGGYEYEENREDTHKLVLQIYRQFSFNP